MIYTVTWLPSADAHLATIWTDSLNRAAVTAAANRIDRELRLHPYANSESRSNKNRVMFVQPLGVSYDVSDDDCLVTVLAVWEINP